MKRLLRNPLGLVSCLFLLVVVIVAIIAPVLTPYQPGDSAVGDILAAPGLEHPLGADGNGRDVWMQLAYGARQSLVAGLIAVITALAVGVPLGLVAGTRGKGTDATLSWLADALMALPGMVVLLAVISRTGPVMEVTMFTFGLLMSPFFFRLTRTQTRAVKDELYVDAATVSGLRSARILWRHILPNVRGPLLIQGAIVLGSAIVAQAGLEFLGLGDPSRPSWGGMLGDAQRNVFVAPHLMIAPGLALGATSCALALLGAAMSDVLSVRPPRSKPKRAAAPRNSSPIAPDGIDIKGLRVAYATEVLHGVDVRVERGEVVGLVGESGSGKTQVALAALGLLPPQASVDAKAIGIAGSDVMAGERAISPLRGRVIAYVPQEPLSNLDPSSRVGQQLTAPMRHHLKLSAAEATERAVALLTRVGIHDPREVMHRFPHELSGGMAQRVLIAGAISCDPEVLIADEPTTALDVTVQAEVLDLLRNLQRERGMAMLIVSHNMGVIADICDRVLVMQHGNIVEDGPTSEVLLRPQHPYTRELLGAALDDAPARIARDEVLELALQESERS